MAAAYKFRVLIDTEQEEEIFRDIVVEPTDTFELFFKAIMAAFEFRGDQLASFYMSNDNWDRGFEISLMDMSVEEVDGERPSVMHEAILKDFMEVDNQKVVLVYDFLKMWCFMIELREILEIDDSETLPAVALEIGVAPNEDDKDITLADDLSMDDLDEGDSFDDEFDEGTFENIDDLDI